MIFLHISSVPMRPNGFFDTTYTGVDTGKDTGYSGVMNETEDHRFVFISGRLALDFVHTVGANERQVFEEWHRPSDLAAWFTASSLRLPAVAVSPADLKIAYTLREAIWATAIACLNHEPLLDEVTTTINDMVLYPDLLPYLDANGITWAAPFTATAALATIARDAIQLLGGPDAQLIRQCANPKCMLLFVDDSRPGKRRWCSMERCGNRAKVATYRHRFDRVSPSSDE